MCGIMGYYSFGSRLPDKNKITNMFSLLENRGRDASGFAFIDNNELVVHKAPIKSSDMIKTDDWKKLELPRVMILHCRMKTQGDEKNNANNHPLFSKQGIAIVHNGVIYNDKEIFGKKQRDAEVDSESILHLLSMRIRGDKIKRLFDYSEVKNMGKAFQRYLSDIGLAGKNYDLRTFRKDFISRSQEAGVPINVTASLVGHSNIKTTMTYYTKLSSNHLKKELKKLK
jgi:glucosamine 6-phosphate synthetase-like amidotransferase/phosphosugar isomerase protein